MGATFIFLPLLTPFSTFDPTKLVEFNLIQLPLDTSPMTPRGFATTHASALAGGDLQKVGGDLYQSNLCRLKDLIYKCI